MSNHVMKYDSTSALRVMHVVGSGKVGVRLTSREPLSRLQYKWQMIR